MYDKIHHKLKKKKKKSFPSYKMTDWIPQKEFVKMTLVGESSNFYQFFPMWPAPVLDYLFKISLLTSFS